MRSNGGGSRHTGAVISKGHDNGSAGLEAGIARRTEHERVTAILRSGIVNGGLPGGTHLVQALIAQALGVSTTPVREALRQLAAEGLVQFNMRGAALVHQLNRGELIDVYELRKLLEPIAVARASKEITRANLLEATELVAAMHSEESPAAWSEINTRFHAVIEESGSSLELATILRRLRAVSTLYVTHSLLSTPERVKAGNAEHREILEAVINRDPDAAAEAVDRHLDGTLRTLLQVRGVEAPLNASDRLRWWGKLTLD